MQPFKGIAVVAARLGLSYKALAKLKPRMMHKQQTGQGQCIDVSMLESLTEWKVFCDSVLPQLPLATAERFVTIAKRSEQRVVQIKRQTA